MANGGSGQPQERSACAQAVVHGLTGRGWQWSLLSAGDAVIALADLRERCIMTTWDPDSLEHDVDVFRHIRTNLDGTLALNAWADCVARGDEVRMLERPIELTILEPGRFA
jgi:hypothetical protein